MNLDAYEGARPQIKAAVLFYPYCGLGSRTRVHGWDHNPDVLALMGTADTVVDYGACQLVFSKLEVEAGKQIEEHLSEGAEHAFDNSYLRGAIAHWYDAEKSADAREKVAAFLAAQAAD